MRAHQLDANGVIINTIIVDTLDFMPGLVDADLIHGNIGDSIVNGALVKNQALSNSVPTEIEFINAIQTWMDSVAQSQKFLSMDSAVTFADEPASPSLQAKGQKLRAWRSQCWDYAHNVEMQAAGGKRAWPNLDGIIAELPAYVP